MDNQTQNDISDSGSTGSNPQVKPIQVMDVKPPTMSNSPKLDNSITPEHISNNTTSYTPPVSASVSQESVKKEEVPISELSTKDSKPSPTSQAKLSTDKLIKILSIIIVALALISTALYIYMKNN